MRLVRSRWLALVAAFAAVMVVVNALAFGLIYATVRAAPVDAVRGFYDGAFGSGFNTGQTLTNAVPLVMVAMGWLITLRAGRIHIGFPGQILIGGLFTAAVVLSVGNLPDHLALVLGLIAGVVGGGLYAGIAALLWSRRGVQEIVSTLLLNLIAIQIVAWALNGPLQEAAGDQPQTDPFPSSARWPTVPRLAENSLSWDIALVPVLLVVVIVLLHRTTFGFRLRLVGANPLAALQAGYSPKQVGVAAMVASGAFSGLAGACLLTASQTPAMTASFEGGYGFNGVAVALLAFNSALGVILTAVLFAALVNGSDAVQVLLNIPASIAAVIQGLVILFVFVAVTIIGRRAKSAAGIVPAGSGARDLYVGPSVAGDV